MIRDGVLVDMAVAVADGATTISEVVVLADQAELFGAVATDSTCWRLLDQLDRGEAQGRRLRTERVVRSFGKLDGRSQISETGEGAHA